MSFWSDKRVLVTGGRGFLGRYVIEKLNSLNCYEVYSPSSKIYDLREQQYVRYVFDDFKPNMVIHLAASLGGIAANAANPGKYFYENIVMGAEVMHQAHLHGVEKYVQVGTSCSYPAEAPTPVKETDLWSGPPNPVTGPYGIAKLALITMAQGYRQQYGLNAVTLIPVNLYGPRDSMDPQRSHVIPALIGKSLEAKRTGNPMAVWGTGKATREFLYAADAADGLVLAAEKYNKPEPVNLGTGIETPIRELVHKINVCTGYSGWVEWDWTKPDGQLTRCFDVSKAKEEFQFEAQTSLDEGLKKTVEWYINEDPHSHS